MCDIIFLNFMEGGRVMGHALKKQKKDYINSLHGDSKGWITKATKDPEYKQKHFKYLDLLEQNMKGNNIYISGNTFYSTYRRIEYIKELKSLYIDLDCYKTGFTKEQIIMNLEENYYRKSIPEPNYLIDSGRGLYLIWIIEWVPSKGLPLWKATQDYLYNVLKPLGADRQALDATRILRVPGSRNSKTGTRVSILDEYNYIYSLRELQKEYLPELKPIKKSKGRPKKTLFVFRERSLYHARIQDLIKLCELREYDLRGNREFILFLYRYYLCYFTEDTEKALQDTLELNSMFVYPVSESEATKQTESAEKVYLNKNKDYKYKNETLIEILDIDLEEQKHMKTIISKTEYKRRKKEYHKKYDEKKYVEKLKRQGKKTKKEQIAERRQKIKSLLNQGFKQIYIAKLLDVSTRTIESDVKFLRENY